MTKITYSGVLNRDLFIFPKKSKYKYNFILYRIKINGKGITVSVTWWLFVTGLTDLISECHFVSEGARRTFHIPALHVRTDLTRTQAATVWPQLSSVHLTDNISRERERERERQREREREICICVHVYPAPCHQQPTSSKQEDWATQITAVRSGVLLIFSITLFWLWWWLLPATVDLLMLLMLFNILPVPAH